MTKRVKKKIIQPYNNHNEQVKYIHNGYKTTKNDNYIIT